jgi:hypothetical protein
VKMTFDHSKENVFAIGTVITNSWWLSAYFRLFGELYKQYANYELVTFFLPMFSKFWGIQSDVWRWTQK